MLFLNFIILTVSAVATEQEQESARHTKVLLFF